MLTKELILCRSRQGRLRPQFLPVESEPALALAGRLLSAYEVESGRTREDIEELTEAAVSAFGNLKVARGLLKVIDDRAEFTAPQDIDYASARMRLFRLSAELLSSGRYADEASYRRELAMRSSGWALSSESACYADLPSNDRLTGLRSLTARQVLERYNVGLVQGVLLRASRLEVTVGAQEEPSRLRRLMRYVRFFRLLCVAERLSDGGMRLTVDGPGSVLEQSKRYGLQLAEFFPAVCSLRRWRLTAEVEWSERPQRLELDETSGLVCPYHNYAAVAPEELRLFERHFRECASSWSLCEESPFLEGPGGALYFPDFSFRHEEGGEAQLELFHRWHATQLRSRLELAETTALGEGLVLGVDRSLLRDKELAARLESSAWFQAHGFLFRDYPTVERVQKALQAIVRERQARKG